MRALQLNVGVRHPDFPAPRRVAAKDHLIGTEVALKGGVSTPGVVCVGDTVRRPVTKESAYGMTFFDNWSVEGSFVYRASSASMKKGAQCSHRSPDRIAPAWRVSDGAMACGGKALRLFHDATVDCELKGEREVVCHGDPTPGNCVLRDGMPFALIDFDSSHPGKREEDIGYAAWMWLHIGDPRSLRRNKDRTWQILSPRTMRPRPGTHSKWFFKLSTHSSHESRSALSGRALVRGRKVA